MATAVVPDHAIVRFMQRAFDRTETSVDALRASGVDVEALREKIRSIVGQGVQNEAPGVTWGKVRFILRGSIVTTVLTRDQFYRTYRSTTLREFTARRATRVPA